MPPEISPFRFPESAGQAGAFAQVICVVVTGDVPLDISWLYNGASELPLGTSTQAIGDRTSILTIQSVSWLHSGDYECLAQNSAAKASFVGELAVQGTKTCILLSGVELLELVLLLKQKIQRFEEAMLVN